TIPEKHIDNSQILPMLPDFCSGPFRRDRRFSSIAPATPRVCACGSQPHISSRGGTPWQNRISVRSSCSEGTLPPGTTHSVPASSRQSHRTPHSSHCSERPTVGTGRQPLRFLTCRGAHLFIRDVDPVSLRGRWGRKGVRRR